jgi:hypothetical protein
MKQSIIKLLTILTLAVCLTATNGRSQGTTELTASLLSKLQNPTPYATDTFLIRFGALNGGLQINPSSGWTAYQVDSYWRANARTLLTWSGVVGATTPQHRYYGSDIEDESRAGSALTSVYNASLNNQAFALITNSDITAFALLDFGFNFADPSNTDAYPFGAFDVLPVSKATSTLWYGTPSENGAGTIGLVSSVPEPSSASLMLLGAAGVLALRRLRKNNV